MHNISRYRIDSRIGKFLMNLQGSSIRFGEHVSHTPGYSPEFLDYRNYRHGDPLKDIDWKLSARTEKVFIKIRESHRKTNMVIAVDGSESMRVNYSASNSSKWISALTCAYICAKIGLKSRDQIYLKSNTDNMILSSEQNLMRALLQLESSTFIDHFWDNPIEHGEHLFMFSDFFVDIERLLAFLKSTSHKMKKIVAFIVQDAYEKELSFTGRYQLLDPESDKKILCRMNEIKPKYHRMYQHHFAQVMHIFKSFGIQSIFILTDTDPLTQFLKIQT